MKGLLVFVLVLLVNLNHSVGNSVFIGHGSLSSGVGGF